MSDRVTIFRFYHPASSYLIGDGESATVVGWTEEMMIAGVDLDALSHHRNQIARVAYVFHTDKEAPESLISPFRETLGFVPETSESETLLRTEIVPNGARDDWFDVFTSECRPDDTVYVIFPDSPENREKFRSDSRETLFV